MHPLMSVPILILACLGLLGCVEANEDFYRQPYGGSYNGNSAFISPQRYPSQSRGHLYDQSHRSWQTNPRRSNNHSWQN
jgi:hypothetical protein